jgi:hypothetical protein
MIALQAAIVGGCVASSNDLNDGEASTMEMRVLSLQGLYPEALEAARGWRTDAILEEATAAFRPTESPGGLTAGYGFRSPSEPAIYLLVWFREASGAIETETREGSNPPDKPVGHPIDPSELPLDSAQVLEEAMHAGGAEFLAEHPNIQWPQTLTLEYEDLFYSQGPVLWIVRLFDRSTLEVSEVTIDASTGGIVER